MDRRISFSVPAHLVKAALAGSRAALAEIRRRGAEQTILERRQPELAEAPAIIHTPRMPTNQTKKGRRQRRVLAARHMGRR